MTNTGPRPPSGPETGGPPSGPKLARLLAARDYFEGAITAAMVIVTACAIIGVTAWVWGQS